MSINIRFAGVAVVVAVLLAGLTNRLMAEPAGGQWLADWKKQNRQWRALHLIGPKPDKMQVTGQLVSEVLAPMGFNVLILEVNYGFEYKSRPELGCRGLSKSQARRLTQTCRQNGIRLIPLFNCLGHQSWSKSTSALLKKYPQFDEAPDVPRDNKGIYCREWCPSNPDVNKVVFDLLDELSDAFDADALHLGMDEVFLIGKKGCPRCKGKDTGDLFAKAVNELHAHVVEKKGLEMMIWGDRLLDAASTSYGRWEASDTGSHRAIDLVPKDIIICDWHYNRRDDYPSIRLFQQKGFCVLPATWKKPQGAVALIKNARKDATDKMLGILFTGWSAGGNGEHLLAALRAGEATAGKDTSKRHETARQIAATIRAGMKELSDSVRSLPKDK